MSSLHGKVALVTGGGRGIGLGIAHRFIEDGARVAVVGRNSEVLDKAVQELSANGGRAKAITADVSEPEEVDRLFDELSTWADSLDVLVNNAGIAEESALVDVTRDSFRRVIDVNLYGPLLLMQRAVRNMPSGGSIVNVASIDAYAADGPFSTYGASKSALVGLTRSAAVELAERGIRVNSVSPGAVMTDMNRDVLSPEIIEQLETDLKRAALRRCVTVEEVAAAVHFLASPAASGITGSDLIVDGGTVANLYMFETMDFGGSD